eukprot:767096-Hanusia_phi.AAC.1
MEEGEEWTAKGSKSRGGRKLHMILLVEEHSQTRLAEKLRSSCGDTVGVDDEQRLAAQTSCPPPNLREQPRPESQHPPTPPPGGRVTREEETCCLLLLEETSGSQAEERSGQRGDHGGTAPGGGEGATAACYSSHLHDRQTLWMEQAARMRSSA